MIMDSETSNELFALRLKTLGLTPADLHGKSYDTARLGRTGKGLFVGHPDGGVDIPGHVRTVNSVAEMKVLGGIPDFHFTEDGLSDNYVDYPPPPPPRAQAALAETSDDICALSLSLGAEVCNLISKATTAFLLGNSAKVAEWEPIINAMSFPLKGTVINADTIVVQPGEPLVISGPGPVQVNANTIQVLPGGQIIVQTEVTFNVNNFIVEGSNG
ncbi:MAG TPA: hypothetical protein VK196_10375 [Magnetospirillum sp.]|nr:hypothetical protein [Magnetospirillum sp.]